MNICGVIVALPEVVTMIKDLVLTGAAGTTAWVAWTGLRKWREELGGKAEFETARELAHATYTLRDLLRSARSPWYPAAEFPAGYDGLKSSPQEEAEAWAHIYQQRITPVLVAVTQFENKALQAEALWGQESRTKTDALVSCVQSLWIAMEAVVSDKRERGENFKSDDGFGKNMRARVNGKPNGTDELSIEVKAAVDAIEQQLKPHLRR